MKISPRTLMPLITLVVALGILTNATGVLADKRYFELEEQPAASAIPRFGRQAGVQIIAPSDVLVNVRTNAIQGQIEVDDALQALLGDTGLTGSRNANGDYVITLKQPDPQTLKQPDPQPVTAAPKSSQYQDKNGLEEVLVTARKRDESIRDIPVAVTVIGQKQITNFNIRNIEDVAQQSPSVEILRAPSGSGASISIRGIASTWSSIGIEQSVATIVDGVYYGQGRVINDSMFDVKQIEILKGPQALFFGKNASAGAINIQTNDPGDEREFIGRIGYEFESEGLSLEAIASVPITDTVGFRFAFRSTKMYDGYIQNQAGTATYTTIDNATGAVNSYDVPSAKDRAWPGREDLLARATLLVEPNENFKFRLKSSYSSYKAISNSGIWVLTSCPALGVSQISGEPCTREWKNKENPIPPEVAATNPLVNRRGGELFDDYKSFNVTADVEYDADFLTLTTVLNYQDTQSAWAADNDSTDLVTTMSTELTNYKAFSGETRALTNIDGPLNFMLGAYYQSTELELEQDVLFGAAENTAAIDPSDRFTAFEKMGGTDGSTFSVFGQLIWDIVSNVQMTAGARYIHETKNSIFEQPYVIPRFQGLWIEGVPITAKQTFDDVTPEVTFTWSPTDETNVYLAYKEGFKSGGFSISGILGAFSADPLLDFTFEPEKSKGIEAGVRTSLLNDSLRIQFEVYDYKFSNLQVDFFNSAVFAFVTTNAGSAKTTGAELQFQWAPQAVKGLRLNGGLAYNDARYTDFIAPCYAGQTPDLGCTISIPGSVPMQDISGVQRPLAPKWTVLLSADYEMTIADNLFLGLSAIGQYKSKYWLSDFGHPSDLESGYTTLDLSARLGSMNGNWQIALIAKNLTDKFALIGANDAPGTGGGTGTPDGFFADRRGTPIMPRTILLQLSYRF